MNKDEALQVIRSNYPTGRNQICEALETLIPELKESDDEKIRKTLKSFFDSEISDYGNVEWRNGIRYGEIVSWLEKQDKESIVTNILVKAGLKPYKDGNKWCILVGDNIQEGICGFGDTIDETLFEFLKELVEKQGEHKYECEYVGCHVNNVKRWCHKKQSEIPYEKCNIKCSEYLKQGEQNPNDKVEPKFKIGDWVVYEENMYQIHNISLKKYYECLRIDGTVHTFDFKCIDSKSRLWTIQDAMKGDVLVWNDCGDEYIFVFDELIKDCAHAFIEFNVYLGTIEDVNRYYQLNKLYPATKEQCDLLFQKMKEAGYVWDVEKKELKKIEQKTAWSEEDDYILNLVSKFTSKGYKSHPKIPSLEFVQDWLKSLKVRIQHQHKQEWSEEDWK